MRGLARYEGAPATAASCTRDAFSAAVDFAVREEVDLVAIAGDVYDGDWRDFSTGMFFAHTLAKLRDSEIPTVIVFGNHDAASVITRELTLPDRVHVLPADASSSVALDDIGAVVHGQSFSTREVTENLAAGYPPADDGAINIGLLHTSLEGHSDHDPYATCAPGDLAKLGYEYWALGHIHVRGRACDGVSAFYAGCLQGRNVREAGAHGGLLVELERGQEPQVEPVDFDVLRWTTVGIDCSGTTKLDDVLALARTELGARCADADGRPLAVRVNLTGETPLHDFLLTEGERLRAELILVANDVAPEALWLGGVAASTSLPVEQVPEPEPELAKALEAILPEARVAADLDAVFDALLDRAPAELTAPDGPLAWLSDREAARARVLELGRARLGTALEDAERDGSS
jgi:exonuclease SbcD